MYLLGYDVGSSSVKGTLLQIENGKAVASATSPEKEMAIMAPRAGFAEQKPEDWWENIKIVTAKIKAEFDFDPADVKAIGISYQMHGLVCIDKKQNVLRPAIIWCDSRAVPYGEKAQQIIGAGNCLSSLMNLPGNFTAAKLAWVKENEPEIFSRIHKILLPGDYIAMKLSGALTTTFSGLSEGMFWDFKSAGVSKEIMSAFGFSSELLPEAYSSFEPSCSVSREAAELLGIKSGIPISYRAGDQPNNAFSLNVIRAGETAATAGTSGVVYGVLGEPACDEKSRVNIFGNVNYTAQNPSVGALLCVNGMVSSTAG